jgi:hypothetical protein
MNYSPTQRTTSRIVSARQATFDRVGMVLVTVAGLCMLSYCLLVGATVYTVSERNSSRVALQTAQADLAEKESEYFKQSNALLASGLESYGYIQDQRPAFVYEGKAPEDDKVAINAH